MSTFSIKVDGVDVTASVIIKDAQFTSAAKGAAGSADFRVRDEGHIWSFSIGKELTLDVDGERAWGGYVAKIERGYFFEADCRCKTQTVPRYLKITGTDYNILLNKRILYDPADPTDMELRRFSEGVYDDTILRYYLDNYTDLAADGVDFDGIERVGIPQTDDFFSGSPSWTIGQFLQTMTSEQLGSIWYIDPDKNFIYTDVDTPNAPYGLSDDPGAGQKGYREIEIDFDGSGLRNDALAWGIGQGSKDPVFSRSTSPVSIEEHGLWQYGTFSNAVWRQQTINRVSHSAVFGSPQNQRGGKDDRVSIKCAVFEPAFRVAQKVAVESEVFDYSDVIPIRYQRITFPSHEKVRFDLVLAHDIDEPWTTLEFWWPDLSLPDIPDILIPDFPVPGLPGDDPCRGVNGNPGGNCIETFSRTVTTGLGVSEIGGATWTASGRYTVDGDEAKISNTGALTLVTNAQGTFYNGLSGGFTGPISNTPIQFSTSPIEILMRLRFAHEGSTTHYLGNTLNFARFQMMLTNQATSGVLSPPYNGNFTGFEVVWGSTSTDGGVPYSPVSGGDSDTLTFGMLVGIQVAVDPIRLIDGVDWSLQSGMQMMVRWRLEEDTVYGRIWQFGEAEPNYWQSTTGNDLVGSAPTYMWFQNSAVPGDNIYIDQYEVTAGLVCNGDGETLGCNTPVTHVYSDWTPLSSVGDFPYDPAGVNGWQFSNLGPLGTSGAGLTLTGVSPGPAPMCVSGEFVINSLGTGSNHSATIWLSTDLGPSGDRFSIFWSNSTPPVNGYQWIASGGRYKIWRTDDGEPDSWSTSTSAQSLSWVSGVSYSYRLEYTPDTGTPGFEYVLGTAVGGVITFTPPVIGNSLAGSGDDGDPCSCEDNDCQLTFESSPVNEIFLPAEHGDPIPAAGFIESGTSSGIVGYLPNLYVAPGESVPFGWVSGSSMETGLDPTDPFSLSGTLRIDSTWANPNQGGDAWYLGGPGNEGVGFNVTSGVFTEPLARWYASYTQIEAGELYMWVLDNTGFFGPPIVLDLFNNQTAWSIDWDGTTLTYTFGEVTKTRGVDSLPNGIGSFSINQSVEWTAPGTILIPSVTTSLTVSGLGCGTGPCPPPDVSSRRICENLTRIETPANSSDEWAYYQASYQMAFGSDEVWLDGLRVDTRDYTMHGLRDVVAFYDKDSVGGTSEDDPAKVVHACYSAVSIGVI